MSSSTEKRPRVGVVCLTYGEPAEPRWREQYAYSLAILRRLTRRVAPIPRPLLPLLAARRGRIRAREFRASGYASPLEPVSRRQAEGLRQALERLDPAHDFDVRLVFEFRPPWLAELLDEWEADPPEALLLLPLYVAESDFTSGISRSDLAAHHQRRHGETALPAPRYVTGIGTDPRLADAMADHIRRRAEAAGFDAARRSKAALLLSAHGTLTDPPPGILSGQCETMLLAQALRERLGGEFAFDGLGWLNHRFGGNWTRPELAELAGQARERGCAEALHFPLGFLGDCAETEVEARGQAGEADWRALEHLPAVNDDPATLEFLARRCLERLGEAPEPWQGIDAPRVPIPPEQPPPPAEPGPLKFGAPVLAALALLFWLAIGLHLLWKGFDLLGGVESSAARVLALLGALGIGALKGGTVLARMARRNLLRLRRLPQPIPIWRLFPARTYFFIGTGTGFGLLIKSTVDSPAWRSAIALGVGLALFWGGVAYLLHWRALRPPQPRL